MKAFLHREGNGRVRPKGGSQEKFVAAKKKDLLQDRVFGEKMTESNGIILP